MVKSNAKFYADTKKATRKLSPEAGILDDYLGSYNRTKRRKRQLELRLEEISAEFTAPSGIRYEDAPRNPSRKSGGAPLAYVVAKEQIEEQIKVEILEMERQYTEIANVFNLLDSCSQERAILEHRYIDGLTWNQIAKAVHITKTPAVIYWRRGLNRLLEFAEVKAIVSGENSHGCALK